MIPFQVTYQMHTRVMLGELVRSFRQESHLHQRGILQATRYGILQILLV